LSKCYVIRQVAYEYTDEYYYIASPGTIQSVCTDRKAAEDELARLEHEAFSKWEMFGSEMEEFSPCSENSGQSDWQALHEYLNTEVGESFFEETEQGLSVTSRFLSRAVTPEQVLRIREISGVRFHELSVFDSEEPEFFAVWIDPKAEYLGADGAAFFYESYDAALAAAGESLTDLFCDLEVRGSLEELSSQPAALRTMIEAVEDEGNLSYDEGTRTLTVRYLTDEEATALNTLRVEPL
jgi:hypothetical protein